jgi:hypothetical protein
LKKENKKVQDLTPLIRKLLSPLWDKADLKGRTWPSNKKKSPFHGTNTTIAFGNELVSVSQAPNGEIVIHEFERKCLTGLGTLVSRILSQGISSDVKITRMDKRYKKIYYIPGLSGVLLKNLKIERSVNSFLRDSKLAYSVTAKHSSQYD